LLVVVAAGLVILLVEVVLAVIFLDQALQQQALHIQLLLALAAMAVALDAQVRDLPTDLIQLLYL
jgi:hypothetical protein